MDVEVSLIEGYQVGSSDSDRLVALLISTLADESLSIAMTADVAVQLGQDLIKAGARLQRLAKHNN